MDDIDRFEAAWNTFGDACSDTVAPEATYQAWFAHFLMEQFDVLQVVREVDFGSKHLHCGDQDRFTGSNLMADIMVLHEPTVFLPRRTQLSRPDSPNEPNPRSGLARLGDFAIISELKVGSSQGLGLGYSQVVRDFHKLDAILRAAQRDYPDRPLPTAVVCILDNNDKHRLDRDHLARRLQADPPMTEVRTLYYPPTAEATVRPRPLVAPGPPIDEAASDYHVDPVAGEVHFGDGVIGEVPTAGRDVGAAYRAGGGSSGNVASPPTDSAISRLLDEISWEGNAKKYRNGGRHLENVVTTEVFSALDFLPRSHFLARVLLQSHGAEEARAAIARDVEEAVVEVLPGDLAPTWRSGETTGWRIQPDALISTPDSLVYVEAKAITGSAFSVPQVARSLHATLDLAGDRTAVLLLVLDAPPPLRVKGRGRASLEDALEAGLAQFPPRDAQRSRDALPGSVAWTTWDAIADSVRTSLAAFTHTDPSLRGSVSRLASALINATRPPD